MATAASALCFLPTTASSRATVRRHYDQYRKKNGLPRRCDNDRCRFHKGELTWNGHPLPLILDHINGVSRDNRAENLRLLCPNCDAQLLTRGGLNKGRVLLSAGGYGIKRQDGKRDYTLFADPGEYRITAPQATLRVVRAQEHAGRRTKR